MGQPIGPGSQQPIGPCSNTAASYELQANHLIHQFQVNRTLISQELFPSIIKLKLIFWLLNF